MNEPGHRPALVLGVCIDDFGSSVGVNDAVLELGGSGRVSAVSCMPDGPAWRGGAAALKSELGGRIDVGLHLDFTEPGSSSRLRRPLPALIAATYARLVRPADARDDVCRQLDAFEDAFGAAPDFVDGHRHVHQLPVIRAALVGELRRRYAAYRPWLRNTQAPAPEKNGTAPPGRDRAKERIIASLGAAALARLAADAAFPQNAHLLGVYGFHTSPEDYRERLRGWLRRARPFDLLMCHPSRRSDDAIGAARTAEYEVLRGDDCPRLLREAGVSLVRLSQALRGEEGIVREE